MSNDIELEMEWLPRCENERADYISRIVDFDDWSLNPVLFRYLDYRWGPHSVDRFASFYNRQTGRFNSGFGTQKAKQWTHSRKIGQGKTIGCVLLYHSLSEQ